MRTILSRLMLSLAFVFFCELSYSATYYFSSSSGSDSRNSSQAQDPATPWKSIDKLNSIFKNLKPGDKVLLKRGDTFYGSINVSASGSSGSPITVGSYGSGAKPIITSLITVKTWKSLGNGIYESSDGLPSKEVKVVLLNKKIQELGRYPNSDASNGGYLTINSASGNHSVSSKDLSSSPNFSGGEVVIRKNHWIIDKHSISKHSGNSINYKSSGVYAPSKGFGFFIQGHLKTLDKFGEWYYNGSNKKLNVYFGSSDPNSNEVQASSLDYLITKSYGANNFRIENIAFNGANKDAIHFAGGTNIQINDVEVENSGENGIVAMSVLQLVINNSRVSNSLNNGISLKYGNVGAKVTNNVVENTFLFQGGAENSDNKGVGIFVTSSNSIIEYNKVINTGYNGISFDGNGTQIKNNLIDRYNLYKNDGGGIYSFGGTGKLTVFKGRKITGNIILNGQGTRDGTPDAAVTSKAHSSGIFLDDNSNGIEVTDNTIANSVYAGIKIANGSNISVKNNTFYNSDQHVLIGNSSRGRSTRDIRVDNNIFFSKHSDQAAYSIKTDFDDISSMGSFNQNYFARPLGDQYSILVSYKKGGKKIDDVLNLKRWQNSFNKDNNSKNLDKAVKGFEVEKLVGENRYKNGAFDKHVKEMACGDCKTSWVSDKLDKGSLKVESPKSSSMRMDIGSVKENKNYILKFKAISNKSGGLRVYFRHVGTPWEVLSPSTTVDIHSKEQEYTVLLQPYADAKEASVMFVSDEGNWTYWMDNIEFKEAEVKVLDPSEKILFEYNSSKSEKTISLNGTYVDAKNNTYTGKVTLSPFSSVVLFNTSNKTVAVPKEAPKVSITSPGDKKEFVEGSSFSIQAAVSAPDGEITKVEYFSGNKILGSTTKSPHTYTWKNIPLGVQTITAVATDSNNLQSTSQEVKVNVISEPIDEDFEPAEEEEEEEKKDENKDKDKGNSQSGVFTALHLNTGSSIIVGHEGIDFQPLSKTNVAASKYTTSAHKGKSESELFQTSSYAKNLSYGIPLPNGKYTVKTYHSEIYFGEAGPEAEAGQRVFDVFIEGELMKDDFDLYTKSGNSEVVLTFENVEVNDGQLDIEMIASANNAVISGLSVLPYEEESPQQANLEDAIFINAGSHYDVIHEEKRFESEYKTMYFSKSDMNRESKSSSELLYQSYRFGSELNYDVPVTNGTYTVITYHLEPYFGHGGPSSEEGQRVFDIKIENQMVKKDFDLFTYSGDREVALTFEGIVVSDGVLNLNLIASANNAVISGIAIIPTTDTIDGGNQNNETVLRINTGTYEDVESDGNMFVSEFVENFFSEKSMIGENENASSDPLYQSYRYGKELKYEIPVENGTYSVITHHNETYFGKSQSSAGANKRVFDIVVQGNVVKKDLDLYTENSNGPVALRFDNIKVIDGILNLEMIASVNNASISGIEVLGGDGKSSHDNARMRTSTEELIESETADEEDQLTAQGGETIKLYPNPAKGRVKLSINKEIGEFSVLLHNMNGQLAGHYDGHELLASDGEYIIPIQHLENGVYLVTIVGKREIVERLRLIVSQ